MDKKSCGPVAAVETIFGLLFGIIDISQGAAEVGRKREENQRRQREAAQLQRPPDPEGKVT